MSPFLIIMDMIVNRERKKLMPPDRPPLASLKASLPQKLALNKKSLPGWEAS
jgi:hypothetical protein